MYYIQVAFIFTWVSFSIQLDFETENVIKYEYYPKVCGDLIIQLKTDQTSYIALANGKKEPLYEISIGDHCNKKTVIRNSKTKEIVASAVTPGILYKYELRGFWLKFDKDTFSFGREGTNETYVSWTDSNHTPFEFLGFSSGIGGPSKWTIESSTRKEPIGDQAEFAGGCWILARDKSKPPPGAFEGGYNTVYGSKTKIYILRTKIGGALVPGKLDDLISKGYVGFNNREYYANDYEVLVDFKGAWVSTSDDKIPPNALKAGYAVDGETLYIGRAMHDGNLLVGKVQKSNKSVRVTYNSTEIPYNKYEILTIN